MKIASAMKQRALDEFDQMVADREALERGRLAVCGLSPREIELEIERCRASIARERKRIGELVTISLLKVGLPADMEMPK